MKVEERFLNYVRIHTTSDPSNMETPSSARQLQLAHVLVAELRELGVRNVSLDAFGYVMAKIPSNTQKEVAPIGFLAHMDTSPDFSGEGVNPQIITAYDGTTIQLNDAYQLNPDEFPSLKKYIGQTLITTDGNTLLGADDKAGIAEIMTMVEYIQNNPNVEHGDICIAFNPDEEVGRGVVKFDVARFGAQYAYTLDGGEIGGLQYENFNAASMKLQVAGRMVHPGEAKDKLVNAAEIAIEFHAMLPKIERPEYTAGYQGFYHLHEFTAHVEQAVASYIIRDHSDELFEKKKEYAVDVVEQLKQKYPLATITLVIENTYLNMRRQVEPVMHIVDLAKDAIRLAGVEPIVEPIRGGTDGSNLSYMGLPCPNIFTGGHNYHGRYEYIPVQSMEKAVEVILNIIKLSVEQAK